VVYFLAVFRITIQRLYFILPAIPRSFFSANHCFILLPPCSYPDTLSPLLVRQAHVPSLHSDRHSFPESGRRPLQQFCNSLLSVRLRRNVDMGWRI